MHSFTCFGDSFGRLLGKPCWNVVRGHGSFLTLEFGEPHLMVIEPRESTLSSRAARRVIAIRGDWHLWIYCCSWVVTDKNGVVMGDSTTKARIDRAARFLNGQALSAAEFIWRGTRTVFDFDLGARLETRPYNRKSEQWMLYEPEGKALSVRADKYYAYGSGDRTPKEVQWRSIARP